MASVGSLRAASREPDKSWAVPALLPTWPLKSSPVPTMRAPARSSANFANAELISPSVLAFKTWINLPSARASCMSFIWVFDLGSIGFTSNPIMVAVGIKSRSSPKRFATNSEPNWVMPVMFRAGPVQADHEAEPDSTSHIEHNGNGRGCCFCRQCRRSRHRGNYIHSTAAARRHP